jgi:hypothetical protein
MQLGRPVNDTPTAFRVQSPDQRPPHWLPGYPSLVCPVTIRRAQDTKWVYLIYSSSTLSRALSLAYLALADDAQYTLLQIRVQIGTDHAPYPAPLFCQAYISVCGFHTRGRIECRPAPLRSLVSSSPPLYASTARVVVAEMRGTRRWLCFRHHTSFSDECHQLQLLPTVLPVS